jgi:hypothetical protein
LFYSCRTGQVVRFTKDSQFLPMWNAPGLPIPNMCAAFSAMGSPVLMPMRPEDGYQVEMAMFGGGTQGKAPNGGSRECETKGWGVVAVTQQCTASAKSCLASVSGVWHIRACWQEQAIRQSTMAVTFWG